MDYEELIDTVITEIIDKKFFEQREQDEEFDNMVKRRIALSEQLEKLQGEALEQAREDYAVTCSLIAGEQFNYLYLQGAKDCARLLKKLDVRRPENAATDSQPYAEKA